MKCEAKRLRRRLRNRQKKEATRFTASADGCKEGCRGERIADASPNVSRHVPASVSCRQNKQREKKARRFGKGIEIQKGKFAAEKKANQRGLKESESVGRERTKQSR